MKEQRFDEWMDAEGGRSVCDEHGWNADCGCEGEVKAGGVEAEEDENVERTRALPATFGDTWISESGRDLVRIALIAGFEPSTLARRLALASCRKSGRRINSATILRVMEEMSGETR